MAVNGVSKQRLVGMSSGMDTDTMIQQMLKLSQLKIDAKYRSKTQTEWKQQALKDIKTEIDEFKNTFLSGAGAKTMRLSSTYNTSKAELTGKNSDAFSVKTSYSTSLGSFSVSQVVSLARGAHVTSAGDASQSGNGFATSTKLKDMVMAGGSKIQFNDADSGDIIGTKKVKVTEQVTEWVDEFDADNNPVIDPDTGLQKQVEVTKDVVVEKDEPIYATKGNTVITINNVDIELNEDMTLGDMMKAVNDSAAGVTMSYDRLADKFTFESKTTGADSTLSFKNANGDETLTAFGFTQSDVQSGSLAEVIIDGKSYTSSTNNIDFRGVTISVNRVTDPSDEATKVEVKRDVTEALAKIKDFVNAYNTLVAKLEGLVKERKTTAEASYTPRTEEELAEMTEKQIEDWNKIAKKGMFRNDAGLQNLTSSMRSSLFESVEKAGISVSSIGLTTGGYFDGKGGQIVLNEDKLIAALEEDPEKVMNAFTGLTTKVDEKGNTVTDYSKSGLVYKIDNLLNNYTKNYQSNSLETLEKSIKNAKEQIEKLQAKMYDEEERLYKKFAAMEKAMSDMQSQSGQFSALLGG